MKPAGFILVAVAAVVVLYNVSFVPAFNEFQVKQHPFETVSSLGSNLKQGYAFKPPFTGFEVIILLLGIIGIVMIVIGNHRDQGKRP